MVRLCELDWEEGYIPGLEENDQWTNHLAPGGTGFYKRTGGAPLVFIFNLTIMWVPEKQLSAISSQLSGRQSLVAGH